MVRAWTGAVVVGRSQIQDTFFGGDTDNSVMD